MKFNFYLIQLLFNSFCSTYLNKTTHTGQKNCHPCFETNWHSNQHQKHLVMIYKWDSFDIKLYSVSKPLRLVLAVISLLEQHNTQLLSPHLEVGMTVFMSGLCNCV